MDGKSAGMELTEYNGKHYGYCFEASNGFQGLIYNKDVFEANGITELPKTLDEFYAVCDKLKASGIVPVAIPSDTWSALDLDDFRYVQSPWHSG